MPRVRTVETIDQQIARLQAERARKEAEQHPVFANALRRAKADLAKARADKERHADRMRQHDLRGAWLDAQADYFKVAIPVLTELEDRLSSYSFEGKDADDVSADVERILAETRSEAVDSAWEKMENARRAWKPSLSVNGTDDSDD